MEMTLNYSGAFCELFENDLEEVNGGKYDKSSLDKLYDLSMGVADVFGATFGSTRVFLQVIVLPVTYPSTDRHKVY
ncbi:hypothetical protein SAMN02745207_04312 [Clostridium grantii DSM 8605]|uniref:Uncharacterized protein n=2 Tax=Clostridium TaxID=1485 RepID=A0A1M5YB50_9CLOT|nr:hypothetical protein SAMN02745207_04312 [Clostridium grantii DSM 8605]